LVRVLNHIREGRADNLTDLEVNRSLDGTSLLFEIADLDLRKAANSRDLNRIRLLEQARAESARRKDRRDMLGHLGILGDAAWDVLLELYISDASGSQLNASTVGAEAAIPQSTALRWLSLLEKEGLVRRRDDIFDKRRHWVGLTPTARKAMDRHFSRALALEQLRHSNVA